jgi:MFS family permease
VLVLAGLVLGLDRPFVRGLPVVLLVAVLTWTPALTYDGPRVQAAAKHVDFVQQIQQWQTLDTPVAVYNAWSGFFAAMAWFCHLAGIGDPMQLAILWPALFALARVLVLRFLFGQVLPRAVDCWVAVTLAVLADSIGSDYFSPQSVGFVVGLAAIGFALSRDHAEPRLLAVLLAGGVLAVSHQFSPYAVGGALVILVLFRQIRPWWTPALVLGPAVVWAALHWTALRGLLNLKAFGRTENFRPPETLAAAGMHRLPVVRETVLALLLGIAVLGVLAAVNLLRHRRDRRYWALACSSLAGLVLVAANPYGQEGIFRAALFGLPWLAVLGAPVLAAPRVQVRFVMAWTTACLTGAYLVSSSGLDAVTVIRPRDVAAIRYFEEHGGPRPPTAHYLLLLGAGDLPTTPGLAGGWHQIWSRQRIYTPLPDKTRRAPPEQVALLTERLVRETADPSAPPALFAMWSPTSQVFGTAYALQAPADAAALRDAFRTSAYWSVAFERDGTYVFRFEPSRYPAAAKAAPAPPPRRR